jgi:2-keto-4-pentenoate hydratase/2-oxohepta-3-ene-1,7-dioic acid hydratase in catechol pathway
MKLARYRSGQAVRIGLVEGDAIADITARVPTAGADMAELIARFDELRAAIETLRGRADMTLADVTMLAPVARPGKMWGIGLNYADHIEEAGLPKPKEQLWFAKAVTAVAGPYQPIQRPAASTALDYEAELVFVVGRGGRHIPRERAASAIFGYCIGNDVSVRDWQMASGQFSIGKSFDTHAPFGPWIVTADEIDARDLGIRCFVCGEKRQDSSTRHLIFDPAAQVAHLSRAMTLEPGDVFYTGTPGGVGMAMKPPRHLKAGDVVRIEIDGLGHIENPVVDEPAPDA